MYGLVGRPGVWNISRVNDVISCCQGANANLASFRRKSTLRTGSIDAKKRCARPRARTHRFTCLHTPSFGMRQARRARNRSTFSFFRQNRQRRQRIQERGKKMPLADAVDCGHGCIRCFQIVERLCAATRTLTPIKPIAESIEPNCCLTAVVRT